MDSPLRQTLIKLKYSWMFSQYAQKFAVTNVKNNPSFMFWKQATLHDLTTVFTRCSHHDYNCQMCPSEAALAQIQQIKPLMKKQNANNKQQTFVFFYWKLIFRWRPENLKFQCKAKILVSNKDKSEDFLMSRNGITR